MYIGKIYSGYAFEEMVLGRSSFGCFKSNNIGGCKYLSFKEAIKMAKNIQSKLGWNSKKPPTRIAQYLYSNIVFMFKNRKRNLKFFSSVGTPLDLYHGVDCFFCLKDKKRDNIVTIDLTINHRKIKSKADIILSPNDIRDDGQCQKMLKNITSRLLYTNKEKKHKIYHFYHKNRNG